MTDSEQAQSPLTVAQILQFTEDNVLRARRAAFDSMPVRMVTNYAIMTDVDLVLSTADRRPYCGNPWDRLRKEPLTDEELVMAQAAFDRAVAEMRRRDTDRGFPFTIPPSGERE